MKHLFALISFVAFGVSVFAQSPLPNGGFEQGTDSWTLFLPQESEAASPSFNVVTKNARSGVQAGYLSSGDFARYAIEGKAVKVKAGERYRIVAWVRAGSDVETKPDSPGILLRILCLGLDKRDASGGPCYIGLDNKVSYDKPLASSDRLPTVWAKIEAVVEISSGVDSIVPQFFAWWTKGSIYFDDLSLEKVAVSTPLSPLAK